MKEARVIFDELPLRRAIIASSIAENGLIPEVDIESNGVRVFASSSPAGNGYVNGAAVFSERALSPLLRRRLWKQKDGLVEVRLSDHIKYSFESYDVLHSSEEVHEEMVTNALYRGGYSVFPVVAERRTEGDSTNRGMLEDRFFSSLLIIVNLREISMEYGGGRQVSTNRVLPENFIAVVKPKSLKLDCSSLESKGINVMEVGSARAEVRWNRELLVPDYEAAVRSVIAEGNDELFLHGVRLPTERDLDSA